MEQRDRAVLVVAAGILACRRAGLPARRKERHAQPSAWKTFQRLLQSTVLSGRQGCRPPRQAGMPDATLSAAAR